MIDLYEFPPTRSQRAKWVLEELELAYQSHIIDLPKGQQNSDAYRAINPLGVVPAIKSENYSLFESVAIVMQLLDEYPEKKLAPEAGSVARAHYYQWCVFAGSELDPAIMMVFNNTMRPDVEHDPKLAALGRNDFKIRADVLSGHLGQQDYMLGAEFSGADILIGHSCFMATHIGMIADFPVLEAYYKTLQTRPAYQRAYA